MPRLPDAVPSAHVRHTDLAGHAAAFIEVDLATMTQTQLRVKLSRYQAYVTAGAWRDTFERRRPGFAKASAVLLQRR